MDSIRSVGRLRVCGGAAKGTHDGGFWIECPAHMQLLKPEYIVMRKDCGGGGDCF